MRAHTTHVERIHRNRSHFHWFSSPSSHRLPPVDSVCVTTIYFPLIVPIRFGKINRHLSTITEKQKYRTMWRRDAQRQERSLIRSWAKKFEWRKKWTEKNRSKLTSLAIWSRAWSSTLLREVPRRLPTAPGLSIMSNPVSSLAHNCPFSLANGKFCGKPHNRSVSLRPFVCGCVCVLCVYGKCCGYKWQIVVLVVVVVMMMIWWLFYKSNTNKELWFRFVKWRDDKTNFFFGAKNERKRKKRK